MLEHIGKNAKTASKILALTPTEIKDQFLNALAEELWKDRDQILSANLGDVAQAQKDGLSDALVDRLKITEGRLKGIIADLQNVINAKDPIGMTFDPSVQPNGLSLYKQRVPLGVLAVIYESRPNVTIDVASLAIKSGNAVILRGGKETLRTNGVFVSTIQRTLKQVGLPESAVQFIDNPDRALVFELLKLHQYIDMVIPRGGAKLHEICKENSMIPVITGGIGICHLFVDQSARQDLSLEIIRNAKIQRPSVCNALDTVLIHQEIALEFFPKLSSLLEEDNVVLHVDRQLLGLCNLPPSQIILPANPEDFDIEWLSLNLSVKMVKNIEEAVQHIQEHSTGHSDGILSEDDENARRFIHAVDSSVVYVNASTRFTDGSQMGLGSEVAISTQRLHARGPMGLEELTTYKWVAKGDYLVRS
jgi:glutamate-5-semialdehyde dehydrogenase